MKSIKNLRLRIITIITLTVYMIALMPINSVGAFETPEFEKVMSLDEMNQDLDLTTFQKVSPPSSTSGGELP